MSILNWRRLGRERKGLNSGRGRPKGGRGGRKAGGRAKRRECRPQAQATPRSRELRAARPKRSPPPARRTRERSTQPARKPPARQPKKKGRGRAKPTPDYLSPEAPATLRGRDQRERGGARRGGGPPERLRAGRGTPPECGPRCRPPIKGGTTQALR